MHGATPTSPTRPSVRVCRGWRTQAPPTIACSLDEQVAYRRVVTVFVPGNDPSALGRVAERERKAVLWEEAAQRHREEPTARTVRAAEKAAAAYRAALVAGAAVGVRTPVTELQVLPEHRNRQPRQFPVVRPDDPVVTYAWPDAALDVDQRARLDALLGRVGRLGHSATPVSCRVVDDPPPPQLAPAAGGGYFLRVPRSGLLDRLEREYARHQGRGERRMPAALQEYGPPRPRKPALPVGVMAGDWIVVEVESPHLGLTRSLELTRAVRDALAVAYPDAGAYLTGRFPDGEARPHVAVVPLADVGHRWASGIVRGVALVLPDAIDAADRERVDLAVRTWRAEESPLRLSDGAPVVVGAVQEIVAGDTSAALWSDVPFALRRSLWCRPARRWVSVTPVALDRHVPECCAPRWRSRSSPRHAGTRGCRSRSRSSWERPRRWWGCRGRVAGTCGEHSRRSWPPGPAGRASPCTRR